MPLTHDEIAAMTCEQVNKEIAIRLCQYYETPKPHGIISDYCHDWSHVGRLLDMMAQTLIPNTYTPSLGCDRKGVWDCYAYYDDVRSHDPVSQEAPTSTEAIARCWLEWYEVTHDYTDQVYHD